MTRKRNVRNITKFKRSIKAISPVIATLLMIAIAVVASLVVYAWVSGYIGFQTNKAGEAIALPSLAGGEVSDPVQNLGDLIVYVQNVGQGVVEVSAVYVDDALIADTDLSYSPDPPGKVISEGNTVEITINGDFDLDERHDIKVTTTSGTSMTLSNAKPGTGSQDSSPPGTYYTLTVNPSANGHVIKNPDATQYLSGTEVMLTPIADTEGYVFQSWSGDVPVADQNANPVTITMDSNKVVTANFVLSEVKLTIETPGTGQGNVMRDVLPPYSYGTTVRLTAAPADSSTFGGWSGDGTTDGDNPLVRIVTLNGDKSVTAIFDIKTFTITPSAGDHGSITPDTVQTVDYGSDSPQFTVTAAANYIITDVKDGATSLGGAGQTQFQYTFTNVQANHQISATFEPASNQGTLYPKSDASYTSGEHTSGGYTDMQTSNNIYYISRCYREWHNSGWSGYYTYDNLEYYCTFDIDDLHITESQVTKLDITLEGHYQTGSGSSVTATQTLYIYNFNSHQWEQKDSASITGTTDTTRSFSITTSIGNYIDNNGNIRVRVNAPDLDTEYFHYNDFFAVAVTYS
jgi:flagellin-like protein